MFTEGNEHVRIALSPMDREEIRNIWREGDRCRPIEELPNGGMLLGTLMNGLPQRATKKRNCPDISNDKRY
jgi:hypothetical protein